MGYGAIRPEDYEYSERPTAEGLPARLTADVTEPAGLVESRAGAEVSVADGSAGGPYYGWLEFGAGFQFLLIGVDVGVDPWEVVDFACGILTFDPVHDDL